MGLAVAALIIGILGLVNTAGLAAFFISQRIENHQRFAEAMASSARSPSNATPSPTTSGATPTPTTLGPPSRAQVRAQKAYVAAVRAQLAKYDDVGAVDDEFIVSAGQTDCYLRQSGQSPHEVIRKSSIGTQGLPYDLGKLIATEAMRVLCPS